MVLLAMGGFDQVRTGSSSCKLRVLSLGLGVSGLGALGFAWGA